MKLLLSGFAFMFLVNLNSANACMYVVDAEKKSAELSKVALVNLQSNKSFENVTLAVQNFSYVESKEKYGSCPAQLIHTAVIQAKYKRYDETCEGAITVTKAESIGIDLDTYSVAGKFEATCK